MGIHATEQALATYGRTAPEIVLHDFAPVACPICGKPCGGRSGMSGERGRLDGVVQHLRFKHGLSKRAATINAMKEPTA